MKVVSYNIRGLKIKGKQRLPREKIKKEKYSIIILQEIKVSEANMEVITEK